MNELIQWPSAKYWTKAWNPVIGCHPCGAACDHCYARTLAHRFGQRFTPHLAAPGKPPRSGVVFCGNMTDLFGDWCDGVDIDCSIEYIAQTLGRSDKATYLWLTKRPANMCETLRTGNVLLKDADAVDGVDYFPLCDVELCNQFFGFTAWDQQSYDWQRSDLPPELYRLDILDGSPPCSTFSMAGSREKAWGKKKTFREGQARQTLDDLVFVYCDTIAKLQPKVAILENVAGLVKGNARDYCRRIVERLDAAGFAVQVFLLNAAKMGVPQTRQRTFFIARRKDLDLPPLKIEVDEPPIPFRDICDTTDATENASEREKSLWLKRRPSDTGLDNIAIRELGKASYFNTQIIHADRVCPTNCAATTHLLYDLPRHLNVSELLLAASFPTDYDCPPSLVGFATGMSVAPVQMAHIASAIREQWLTKKGSQP